MREHMEVRPKSSPSIQQPHPQNAFFFLLSQSEIKYENLLEYKRNMRQALLRVT